MKKIALGMFAALVLGACLPFNPNPAPNQNPTVDTAGTIAAANQTAAAQTLAAQPTPTSVIAPTETLPPPVDLSSPSPTVTETPTASPEPNLTTTVVTATNGTLVSTISATAALPAGGSPTLTPTNGILTYGTLPPAVPFSGITLINKAHAEAYISLQVTTIKGGPTIIEYPVERIVNIQAPVGYYLYVAWVGGNKMVGNFSLRSSKDLLITLYKDKVVIR